MVPCVVENASVNGLMLHSDVQIAPRTAVELQVCMQDEIARLSGWVVHSTSTINGVKIGAHLHFDGSSPQSSQDAPLSARRTTGHLVKGKNKPWDVEAAANAATSRKKIEDEEPSKRLIREEHVAYLLEKLFVLGCVAGVSYIIGSMVLPAVAR
jgi:hypothetical protein